MPPPPPLLRTLCLGLALLGGGLRSASADDPQCTVLLSQAQAMLVEVEAAAMRGQDAKAESVAIRALPLVDKAFDLCPDSRDACGMGVLLAVFARDATRANEWLTRYAQRTPFGDRDPQLHYFRAVVEVRLISRPDLGLRSLERMQALAPGLHPTQRDTLYYEALLAYGSVLIGEERHEEAMRMYSTAAGVARRSGKPGRERRARAMLGIALGQADRQAEAAQLFKKLHEEDPASPIWSYQLGLSLAQLLRYDEAITAYRHSLEHQPGYQDTPQVLQDLARARLRLGNCLRLKAGGLSDAAQRERALKEAQVELTRYQAERPEDPLGALWLGVLLFEELDRPLDSIAWFEKALALDPECETTLNYLLRAHGRAGAPVPPEAPEPSAAEWAAWRAKAEAWTKDRDENAKRRKEALRKRTLLTGDASGGCL